jgi:hypothetical protein
MLKCFHHKVSNVAWPRTVVSCEMAAEVLYQNGSRINVCKVTAPNLTSPVTVHSPDLVNMVTNLQVSISGGKLTDQLSDYQLRKEDAAARP